MSAITVLFNRNGERVDENIFQKMFSSLDIHGVDGSRVEIIENVAFGHQHFWCVPEEVKEEQPLKISENLYVLMDGRFDNRSQLLKKLEKKQAEPLSDALIAGLLFNKYGKVCFESLLGSYVLVFYELNEKRVTAVRDHLGDRTLFYHLSPKLFAIASEEKSLIQHKDISRDIDDSRVAVHFAYTQRPDDSTYFKDIKEMYPATYIEITENSFKYESYWDLKNQSKVRYKQENEYFEHFRSIFESSIDARMRSVFEPTVLLSGGVDSSSIVAVVSEIHNTNNLKTASYYFNKFNSANELQYINSVNDKYGLLSFKFEGDKFFPFQNFLETDLSLNKPLVTPFFNIFKEVFSTLVQNEKKMILNGWAADNLFVGANEWLADIFKDRKLITFMREICFHTSKFGTGWLYKNPAPRHLLSPLKPVRDYMVGEKSLNTKPWLSDYSNSFIKQAEVVWSHRKSKHHRLSQINAVCGLNQSMECASYFDDFAGGPIDLRYPFRDRKMVEFALNIPAYMIYSKRSYKNKYILTETLKDHLPQKIYNRNDHGDYSKIISHGYQLERKGIADYLKDKDNFRQFVDPKWFDKTINSKEVSPMDALIIWQILCFEIWIEKLYN